MAYYKADLVFPEESHAIVGAAMTVHRLLGCGFSEKVYQDAFEVELQKRGIPYLRETELKVVYQGVELPTKYVPDFICYDKIIVELKALRELDDMCRSQAINYSKVSGYELSILINFGELSLRFERYPNRLRQ
ncbi:MAG: GxxExxY protein [Prevotella sp.]|nr:GxxExxY protein [Prevotella sp.]